MHFWVDKEYNVPNPWVKCHFLGGIITFEFDWIKPKLEMIYGVDGYDYYYNTDATATEIKRGLIYITPKML